MYTNYRYCNMHNISYSPQFLDKTAPSPSEGVRHIKKYLLLGSALLLFTSASTHAQEDPWKHDFSVGADMSRYRYKEKFADTHNKNAWMKLESNQVGVFGAYRLSYNSFFVEPSVQLNYGHARYVSWNPRRLHPCAAEPTLMFEGRLLTGYSFVLSDMSVAPYMGIGFRHKQDDSTLINDKLDDASLKLKRVNMLPHYFGGIEAKYTFDDSWSMKINAEIKKSFSGRLYCYDRNQAPSPTVFDQKGWGASIKGMFYHHFEKIRLGIGAAWDVWYVKRSKDEYGHHRKRTDLGGVLWGYGASHEPKNVSNLGKIVLEVSW